MTNMSELFVPAARGSAGFSRDMRFAPSGSRPAALAGPDPAEPIALAFTEGHAAGIAEAAALAAAMAQARDRLAFSFARLDADLAEQLRDKLHAAVTALCEVALRPLALDSEALRRRVEVAVAMFVRADDERVIRLHPDDLALAGNWLVSDWQILPDPALERGALRVETVGGGLEDGPAQWRTAIEEALRLC